MPRFDYQGRDANGARVRGALDASSLDAAVAQLFDQGVTPLDVTEGGEAGDGAGGGLREQLGLDLPRREELALFARQAYALTRSGVPLIRGLTQLAESTRNRRLAETIRQVIDDLEAGRDLASALARHPRIFTPLFVAMIRVGETSGRLEEAFERMHSHLEREHQTVQQMKTATRYPMFVVIAIAVAVWVLMTWVIPVFAGIFERFDAPLPLPTRILIAVSGVFASYGWVMLALAGLGWLGFRTWARTEQGRLRWDRLRLKFPIVGEILLRSTLARFARAFAMAYRSGVPILESLTVVAQAADNAFIARTVLDMREAIERGESLSRAAGRTGVFTPLILQMLAVGEETGRLDEMVEQAAEFYEREVDYDVRNLTSRIEPLLTVGIAVLVFLLALGVFLPMWDLGQAAMG